MSETTEKLDGIIAEYESMLAQYRGYPRQTQSFQKRLTAWQTVKDMMDAMEKAKLEMLHTHEKGAEELAIAAGLGVSEWEAFMPSQYHTITKYQRTAEERIRAV